MLFDLMVLIIKKLWHNYVNINLSNKRKRERERERNREREKEREREIERDRETERQWDRERQRETERETVFWVGLHKKMWQNYRKVYMEEFILKGLYQSL